MTGPAVALTFDLDALAVWIGSYGATSSGVISRGEIEPIATARILALLDRYDVRSTFFVPGHSALAYPDLIDEIVRGGHELGHHGFVHERVSDLSPEREREVMALGIEILERHTGHRPAGYRSPSWDFTAQTPRLLVEQGFRYDSSLMGSDFTPYWVREGDRFPPDGPARFGATTDVVELPVSWLLDDFPHFEYIRGVLPTMKPPSAVREIWWGEFTYYRTEVMEGCFTLTLHPQCIGRGHRLIMLDQLVADMAQAGARFVTLSQAAGEWRKGQGSIP